MYNVKPLVLISGDIAHNLPCVYVAFIPQVSHIFMKKNLLEYVKSNNFSIVSFQMSLLIFFFFALTPDFLNFFKWCIWDIGISFCIRVNLNVESGRKKNFNHWPFFTFFLSCSYFYVAYQERNWRNCGGWWTPLEGCASTSSAKSWHI